MAYCAVGVGEGDLANSRTLVRGVQGFGHEDRAGNGEVVLVGDQGCATEVRGGTDTLDDAGQGDEGLPVWSQYLIT